MSTDPEKEIERLDRDLAEIDADILPFRIREKKGDGEWEETTDRLRQPLRRLREWYRSLVA